MRLNLEKAREQVKQMVIDGVSLRRISSYLYRWVTWWVRTTESWSIQELLGWFIGACWEPHPATAFAAGLLYRTNNFQMSALAFPQGFEADFAVVV